MATHATVWSGLLSQSSATLSVGYAVVKNGDDFLPATTANRASYGRAVGIAITATDSNLRSFEYQVAGVLSADVSGIGTGAVDDYVIVDTDGSLTRTASPGGSDDVIGRCPSTTGDVSVQPLMSLGGSDPTGTGLATVTSGAFDAAAASIGSGFLTWAATPTSANLLALLTTKTGTGLAVFGTSPTLTTPNIGAATATSVTDSGGGVLSVQATSNVNVGTTGSHEMSVGSLYGGVRVHTTLKLADSNNTHSYIFVTSNLTSDRNVTWPLLTGNDTVVCEAHAQTLSNKTIASPAVTGTATYTNGKTSIVAKSGEHQTTTATTTAVAAVTTTIADNTTTTVDFIAIMRAVGATAKGGRWGGKVTYYRNGGAPQIVGSATYDTAAETTAGDDVAFNLSTNDLEIRVTSADADDRNWSIEARVQTVTNAA